MRCSTQQPGFRCLPAQRRITHAARGVGSPSALREQHSAGARCEVFPFPAQAASLADARGACGRAARLIGGRASAPGRTGCSAGSSLSLRPSRRQTRRPARPCSAPRSCSAPATLALPMEDVQGEAARVRSHRSARCSSHSSTSSSSPPARRFSRRFQRCARRLCDGNARAARRHAAEPTDERVC
jgi:hypothetical protein